MARIRRISRPSLPSMAISTVALLPARPQCTLTARSVLPDGVRRILVERTWPDLPGGLWAARTDLAAPGAVIDVLGEQPLDDDWLRTEEGRELGSERRCCHTSTVDQPALHL
jgi:hypothetical protein